MKNDTDESRDEGLTRLLELARPEPQLPPRFQESVWRRIERQEFPASGHLSWLDQIAAGLLRPRLAAVAVVLLLLFGGILGVMDGTTDARQAARDRYVASVAPVSVR